MTICKNMTDEDYEDCYREAIRELTQRYDSVGPPYECEGQRVCTVETLILDDPTVFLLAWGPETAAEIGRYSKKHALHQAGAETSVSLRA